MDILQKHKKKGRQGFHEFIYYLELAEKKRVSDILSIAWLEDPVYTQWLAPNIVDFNYFLTSLAESDYEKIYLAFPNGAGIFTFAFWNSAERNAFVEKLPTLIQSKYVEAEQNVTQVAPFQRLEARNSLIKKMRELQERADIKPFPWKLPSDKVLKGEHFPIPSGGRFQLKYENGTVALEGGYEKKLRAGPWSHYHPNGQLMAKGHYSEGEKFGPWSFYDPRGKIISEGQFRENLKQGQWKEYDETGTPKMVNYERGRSF